MSLKLAIWDMDGTLVDSRQIITDAMADGFIACGLTPPTYEQTRKVVGLSLKEACAGVAPPDISQAQLLKIVDAYKNAFVVRRAAPDYHTPLYDGALETLEALRSDGWLIAMATGKSHRGIRSVFEHQPIKRFFDTIWCADDGPGKPHPFMVNEAMRALGAEQHQSVMIGDAIHDITMGRNAGVRTLGVSWGFGETAELEEVEAHEIHHDFATLKSSLLDWGKQISV